MKGFAFGYYTMAVAVMGFLRGCDHCERRKNSWKNHVATFFAAALWPGALVLGWWVGRRAAGGE